MFPSSVQDQVHHRATAITQVARVILSCRIPGNLVKSTHVECSRRVEVVIFHSVKQSRANNNLIRHNRVVLSLWTTADMDCGIVLSKTLLLFLSLIFWAAGAALAFVGSYVIRSYKNFEGFMVDKSAIIPVAIILAVAVVMFIVGLIGCCATLRESKVGLGFFLLIILLVFAAEVTALVFGIIYRGKVNEELDKSMNDIFEKYKGNGTESEAVDYLQTQLKCCGVLNYTDWSTRPYFTEHKVVPKSCCKANTTCNGELNHPELLNTKGCKSQLEQLLQNVLSTGLLVVMGLAILKLLGIIGICMIACRSSRNDYQPLYS